MIEQYYRNNYQRHVNAIKKRYKGDPDSASDIVQEAFLRATIGMKTFDPNKGNFHNWFSKILYRTYLDFIDREHKRSEHLLYGFEIEDWIDYEQVYENRDIIQKAIKDTDERFRTTLKLFYLDGYSAYQIHNITKLSEVYIRQICHRFRISLKTKWGLPV